MKLLIFFLGALGGPTVILAADVWTDVSAPTGIISYFPTLTSCWLPEGCSTTTTSPDVSVPAVAAPPPEITPNIQPEMSDPEETRSCFIPGGCDTTAIETPIPPQVTPNLKGPISISEDPHSCFIPGGCDATGIETPILPEVTRDVDAKQQINPPVETSTCLLPGGCTKTRIPTTMINVGH